MKVLSTGASIVSQTTLICLILLAACHDDRSSQEPEQSFSPTAPSGVKSGDSWVKPDRSSPPHALLAVIHSGNPMVTRAEISAWELILDRLCEKCPHEPRERVGDFLVAAHRELNKRGSTLDLKQTARLIDESIPPEGSRLLDCPTLFTTAVVRELSGQPRLQKDKAPY